MARVSHKSLIAAVSVAAVAALSTLVGVATAAPTAVPAASCTAKPYAYAGLFSNKTAQGIQAVVTTLADAQVPSGHVAGWIGVGGPTDGPNGQAEWLQTGVTTAAGSTPELYAEITQPGLAPKYVTLASGIVAGSSYNLDVQQLTGKPNVWQVLVNGVAATDPIYLPGSNHFEPMAMSESWNGGTTSCNAFAYHFGNVRIANKGSWQPLTDVSTLRRPRLQDRRPQHRRVHSTERVASPPNLEPRLESENVRHVLLRVRQRTVGLERTRPLVVRGERQALVAVVEMEQVVQERDADPDVAVGDVRDGPPEQQHPFDVVPGHGLDLHHPDGSRRRDELVVEPGFHPHASAVARWGSTP